MTRVKDSTRNSRAKTTGEVFTPPHLINEMLDKLPSEMWEPERTFVDPSAGNGNMVMEILKRKIEVHGHDPTQALSTTYGCDLMADNVIEMRHRIAEYAIGRGADMHEACAIIKRNIVCKNALEFDFEF